MVNVPRPLPLAGLLIFFARRFHLRARKLADTPLTAVRELADGRGKITGKVVALGRKYDTPTPGQEAVYAILKPYRMGRQAARWEWSE